MAGINYDFSSQVGFTGRAAEKMESMNQHIYIEGILYVRQAASRKAGGQGIRYVCEVEGSIAVLFHDEPYWFIEREESVSKA